jgi:hypothetical protein
VKTDITLSWRAAVRIAIYIIAAIGAAVGPLHPTRLEAQSPTPESIAAAVARGSKSQEAESASGESGGPSDLYGYAARMTGPLNRIRNAAAEASRKGLPFTPDSVVGTLSSPAILLEVVPKTPTLRDGAMVVPARPRNLVIRSRVKDAEGTPPIEPDSVQTFPVEWTIAGQSVTVSGIRAFFDPARLPRRDFDVLVITSKTEKPIVMRRDMVEKVR